jgi:iron complex transport system substrate-binding protein
VRRGTKVRSLIALLLAALLTGCAPGPEAGGEASAPETAGEGIVGSMELTYAEQFSVDYYADGSALISIVGAERPYLLLADGATVETEQDVVVIQEPVERVYLAASSAMDDFRQLDALDTIALTSTKAADWSLPVVQQALEEGTIRYAGKYSAPDYELILSEGCDLAIESTMIYHSPETQERLEALGIPVLVERSSYETHPLGRLEWIKLYGLLTGHLQQAEDYFAQQVAKLEAVETQQPTGKTVAFFYISTSGYAVVRKSGDYVAKMIELAGGTYLFSDLTGEENALSTQNMQLEQFYAYAQDADYLIYNSAIDGELQTVDQLLEKCPLLADCRAVQEGNVWCTGKNMFQETTGIGDMIADLHAIVSDEAEEQEQLTYLHRLR